MANTYDVGRYPGETANKQAIRSFIHRHAAERLKQLDGWQITVAGPEASEVADFRLHCDPKKVIFVDIDPAGLRLVRERWPEAHCYYGPIEQAIQLLDKIAFLNLDLMGQSNDCVIRTLKALKTRLLEGGVLAYTFMRGRENRTTKAGRRLLEACGGTITPVTRWAGTEKIIRECCQLPMQVTKRVNYRSHTASMSLLMLQHQREPEPDPGFHKLCLN